MKHRMLCALAAFLWPAFAQAHMKLMYPPSRVVENGQGDPQKGAGPCNGGGTLTPTKIRTKFKPGQTVTVIWKETVHHPGHFRIAVSDDDKKFHDPQGPQDILDPPVLPVLKDGLFPDHAEGQMLKTDITLPSTACKACTLQVIQAMIEGSGVSMYYHCADIEITDDAPAADGGAAPPTADAGAGTGGTGGYAGTGGTSGTGGTVGTVGTVGTGGTGYPDAGTSGSPGSGTSAGSGGVGGSPAGTGGTGVVGGTGGTGSPVTGGSAPDAGQKTSNKLDGSFAGCAVSGTGHTAAPASLLALAAVLAGVLRRRSRSTRR
jgi:MYXO-CTERM domain-containing protein